METVEEEASGTPERRRMDSILEANEMKTSVGAECVEVFRQQTLHKAAFDDFTLLSLIGVGTFGKVYLVH